MRLIVIAGTGAGSTERAAYLQALAQAERSDFDVPRMGTGATCAGEPRESSSHPSARSQMTQSQPGRWAHAALGWLHDTRAREERFFAMQDENLERLQRRLLAAVEDTRRESGLLQARLHSRFMSIVCRGDPVCALVLATYDEALAPNVLSTKGIET